MAVFRSASNVFALAASTVVTKPASTVSGDVLVAFVFSSLPLSVTAAGFTVANSTTSAFRPGVAVLWKKAGGAEPASYTFSVTSGTVDGNNGGIVLAAYSAADFLRQVLINPSGSVQTITFLDPTTLAGAGDKVLRFGAVKTPTSAVGSTVTPSTGLTSRLSFGSGYVYQPQLLDEDAPGQTRTLNGGATVEAATVTAVLATYHAPNAPTLLAPTSSEALNRDAANVFSWQHSDVDGDGQSSYDLRYRIVGAATWTTVSASTPNQFREFAAGTFAAGSYEWQVRTYDTTGRVGPYSGSGFFTAAAAPAGPAITAPTNGATIGTATATLTWTAAAQTSYQVRKVADLAGAADTATVLYDSGEVVSSSVRSVPLTFDVNSRYEHLQVRVKDAGLFSPWTSVRVLVSYTLPATALLSVVPDTAAYALAVQVLNPAPTNGQPARSFNRIYVTALSPGDSLRPMGVRKLAASSFVGSLFVDDRVASGVSYGYEVETVASNGTASMSDLVAEFRDLGTGGGGGTPGAEGDYADADYAPADFA